MFSVLPLNWFYPFRRGAVAYSRGSLLRSGCIAVLKAAKRGRNISRLLAEIRPLDSPDISFRAVDSMVMDDVYWFGIQGYEGKLADVWIDLCARSENILEIGGNIGFYTVIGARQRRGRYTVLEPVPVNAQILRDNLARNGIGGVTVLEAAAIAATEPGLVSLNIPSEGRDAPVGAHLVAGVEIDPRSSAQVLAVSGLPMRSLVERCDLLKIDAEGIEADLLESVLDILSERKPTLVLEVLPEAERLGRLLAELAARVGYCISVVPAYGTDVIASVAPQDFSSAVPSRYNSKDVVLSAVRLQGSA